MKRPGLSAKVGAAVTLLIAMVAFVGWALWPRPVDRPSYSPHSSVLRSDDVYIYPPRSALRGTIVFFGNDVGFWKPHQELADFLSRHGYAVIGYDLRRLLKSVADSGVSSRDMIVGDTITTLIAASIDEFHGQRLPLLLLGHSLGAEVAIWAGAHITNPRPSGVVAMAPGSRGHLTITPRDYLSSAVPDGPDSFSMADLVRSLPRSMKVAIVRGASDGYGGGDPQIVAAGAGRVERFTIPFAGHSLKKILIARYVIEQAMDWVLTPKPPSRLASN
jgi:pimeloyl-ACP methyl ester carboxylesterase